MVPVTCDFRSYAMDIFRFVFLVYWTICLNIRSSSGIFKLDRIFKKYDLNSDAFLDSVQLLQKYNYPSETHTVITDDGYKLNLYRIPGKGAPVLLVHGIADTSDSWLVLGPKYSLAYQLADAGYDVWLLNARGNRYSKGHINNLPSKLYWNFSYEEIGSHDLPASIDHILYIRNLSQLTYIGFSQGTTAMFVMCSMRPEYNKKIGHAILLAPVAGLRYLKYPFIRFWSENLSRVMSWAESNRLYEVFPFNVNFNKFHNTVCDVTSPFRIICELEYYKDFGLIPLTNLVPEKLPILTAHLPGGTSAKVFFHFVQGYSTQKFQRFDYGKRRNLELYSSSSPPEYDVSKVDVPMTIFTSEVDWFSNNKDVQILLSELKTVQNLVYFNESLKFSHLEFVYGSRVNSLINKPVLNILESLPKL